MKKIILLVFVSLILIQSTFALERPINIDSDNDGLSDQAELTWGTDPYNPDTDGDGLKDGEEIRVGTDPRDPDMDHDGLTDAQEFSLWFSPTNPNSDCKLTPSENYLLDIDESKNNILDGDEDWDGDGIPLWKELADGTDPFNDADMDGAMDSSDKCPNTPLTQRSGIIDQPKDSDYFGCSCEQIIATNKLDDSNPCTIDECKRAIVTHKVIPDRVIGGSTTCLADKCDGRTWVDYPISVTAECKSGVLTTCDNRATKYQNDNRCKTTTGSSSSWSGGGSSNYVDIENPNQPSGGSAPVNAVQPPLDSDEDGITDSEDNCVDMANLDQRDSNKNGIGDACEKKLTMPWIWMFLILIIVSTGIGLMIYFIRKNNSVSEK